VDISSPGYRTDLMVLSLGGSQITYRSDHVVVRTPANPHYWWGNFILFDRSGDMAERLALFAAESPRPNTSPGASTPSTAPPATRRH
jgi:hypothetical protein